LANLSDLERFERLTAKQRDCLDLVLERKTSKEIARILDVSKPTVDQRLTSARVILDQPDRDRAALAYARLLSTYDRATYDSMQLPPAPAFAEPVFRGEGGAAPFELREAPTWFGDIPRSEVSTPSPLGMPIGDLGTVARLGVMMAMTLGLLVAVLVSLSIAQSLSSLLTS
jgi:DNA-binding CsgD family transcriptional regulator